MKRKWTDKEIEILKDYWGKITPHDIAKILNRTLTSIRYKGYSLKLGPAESKRYRPWAKEEEDYLDEKWGETSIPSIAKKLNRSVSAVEQKAYKMGLGSFTESGDFITVNELITRLKGGRNTGRNYFIDQCLQRGLPYFNKKINKASFKVVRLDDFWKWAEGNRTLIDFKNLERNILGMEPEWLEEQRRADKKMAEFKKTPWTKSEDKRLLTLLREFKHSYREISQKLNRTEGAIKRRIYDLGYKERPIAMNKHNPWSDSEVEIVKDLFNKGYRHDLMTKDIDRSAQAIRGKIERMIREGDLEPRSPHRKTC